MFTTINPATGKKLKDYKIMSSKEALEIAKNSDDAFRKWRKLTIDERLVYLKTLTKVLRENKQEYAEIMTNEMGKIITESLAEVEKCAWLIEDLIENSSEWLKEESIKANGKEHIITFKPLGAIYIIMPWNYAFWQVFKVAMGPIVAGNTILLKHSANVTGSALIIEKAFEKANFPKNILRTLIINHDTSQELIESDFVKAVSITGSVRAGRTVGSQAGNKIKKSVLELGGSDPFIILKDANIDSAVKGAISGRLGNCGQVCIGAKRFIVHEDVLEEFSKKITEAVKLRKIGDPLDTSTQIGPMVNDKAVEDMLKFIDDAIKKGAVLQTGGKKLERQGSYFEPAVLTDVTQDMKVFNEEAFGPIIPIISFSTEDEAIEIANNSEFGLNSSIWSEDILRAIKLARRLETGGVFVNNFSSSHPSLPLGGIKNSGYGKELSKFAIKEFTNIKPINVYETKK